MTDVQLLLNEVLNEVEIEQSFEAIFEVSPQRSKHLKNLEKLISELKENNSSGIVRKMSKEIKEFTGIDNVSVTIKKGELNACVIPIYSKSLASQLITEIRSNPSQQDKNLVKPNKVPDHLDKISIVLGSKLLKTFTNREIVAIILHELGHVFQHTSNFANIIQGIIRKLAAAHAVLKIGLFAIALEYSITITIAAFIVTRSLIFVEHMGEYKADEFAAKYGYGDEIIKVLHYFHDRKKDTNIFKKTLDFIVNTFILPQSHPTDSKRMCKLAEKMKKDYIHKYPDLKKELNIYLSDVKCPA